MNIDKFLMDHKETDEEYVLYLSGELDLSAAPQLRAALESVVNRINKPFIINLKDLKYIDSTGIGIIISVLKVRDELNAPFSVREIPAPIKRLFDLTGISEFLEERKEKEA
jgi:anti-sigma B factor antagonist